MADNTNTIASSGNMRQFMLAVPKDLDPKEHLPLIFLWHWLGGSAHGFYEKGDVQNAADQQRFLAVIPSNKKVNGNSDLYWKWPFAVSDSQARMDEHHHRRGLDRAAYVEQLIAVDQLLQLGDRIAHDRLRRPVQDKPQRPFVGVLDHQYYGAKEVRVK